MTKEEYLTAIRTLSGIEVPTEEQQATIETLVSIYDASQTTDRITQLEAELEAERTAHQALQNRFRESFWSGKPMKDSSAPNKKNAYDIGVKDLFK